ncbi:hypothetical protein M378DRAFT_454099 [Amanita muscaria Koide BX008]|uniref:Uncharacterized protein n=1 Tax=Amanita muscaria (strain Koide BX008) TaxID=946122 RepID=A0A0C2W6H8_AMAMK|nr:hypothetical protein M378DRAFT_454099 [Amanita muscaria Koide BX008]
MHFLLTSSDTVDTVSRFSPLSLLLQMDTHLLLRSLDPLVLKYLSGIEERGWHWLLVREADQSTCTNRVTEMRDFELVIASVI